ncbi:MULTISPECIES: hypothetical protein [unclassified Frankia]|uniref:hypothetical protein n=1 Tax=unclassified Frankia TaxID=2632575 RepID=UPI002AD36A05|nr:MULTISPECIES: hypothetical protein [unclassified Frankia]
MSGDGQPSAHRRYALALLAADEAYDRNLQGEPVLFVSDLRRGLLAVLALTPEALLRSGDGVTEGEALAFLAGQRAALDAAHTALAAQWQSHRLRRRVPRATAADTVEPGRLVVVDGDGAVAIGQRGAGCAGCAAGGMSTIPLHPSSIIVARGPLVIPGVTRDLSRFVRSTRPFPAYKPRKIAGGRWSVVGGRWSVAGGRWPVAGQSAAGPGAVGP